MNYQNENTQNNPGNASQTPIDYRAEWENVTAPEWLKINRYFGTNDFWPVKVIEVTDKKVMFNVFDYYLPVLVKDDKVLQCFEPVGFGVPLSEIYEQIHKVKQYQWVLEQSAKLTFQYLKFIPRKYSIVVNGMSDSIKVFSINKTQYDFWTGIPSEDVGYILTEYEEGDEDMPEIPNEVVFMDIGSCWGASSGDLFDYSGARLDSGYSDVTVYDENSNPVWNCKLDKADLVTQAVGFLEGPQHFDSKTLTDEVEYYATLVDEESGIYTNSGFWLLDEFDPKKLAFQYFRYEGKMYIDGFFYDGREIKCDGNNSCGGGPEFTFNKR